MSSALVGYVIMSYIMTATPMSMHIIDGFSLMQTKFVIQSHVIAMSTIIILLSPNNLTIIGVNKEGRNIAITWDRMTNLVREIQIKIRSFN
jgi:hypothetical protein